MVTFEAKDSLSLERNILILVSLLFDFCQGFIICPLDKIAQCDVSPLAIGRRHGTAFSNIILLEELTLFLQLLCHRA